MLVRSNRCLYIPLSWLQVLCSPRKADLKFTRFCTLQKTLPKIGQKITYNLDFTYEGINGFVLLSCTYVYIAHRKAIMWFVIGSGSYLAHSGLQNFWSVFGHFLDSFFNFQVIVYYHIKYNPQCSNECFFRIVQRPIDLKHASNLNSDLFLTLWRHVENFRSKSTKMTLFLQPVNVPSAYRIICLTLLNLWKPCS